MLPELINEDQTGFKSGRYIGDNLRLIYDMIAYLKENNLPGLLLNICEQVLFVRFTIIPPRLTDQCNFITVL